MASIFVEDGILQHPISRTWDRASFFDKTLRFHRDGYDRFDTKELWLPEYIDKRTWMAASQKFQSRRALHTCIQLWLFPLLTEPEAIFHYVDTRRPLEESFKKMGILEAPIRTRGRDVFYFDSHGIYQKGRLDKAHTHSRYPYLWHSFQSQNINTFSWRKAVSSFVPGMTLGECLERFKHTRRETIPTEADYSDFERLVQKIERPQFERSLENTDKNTVDRIRVCVHLPRYLYETRGALKQAVQYNKAEIDKLVLKAIEDTPRFKKLGVPLSFFSLSECTIRRDYVLEYLFDLIPL